MKTIEQIEREIAGALSSLPIQASNNLFGNAEPIGGKKVKSKLEFLREVKKYLETNPTEDFVKSEIARLLNLKDKHERHWEEPSVKAYYLSRYKELKGAQQAFDRDGNVSGINSQLKTLRYLTA